MSRVESKSAKDSRKVAKVSQDVPSLIRHYRRGDKRLNHEQYSALLSEVKELKVLYFGTIKLQSQSELDSYFGFDDGEHPDGVADDDSRGDDQDDDLGGGPIDDWLIQRYFSERRVPKRILPIAQWMDNRNKLQQIFKRIEKIRQDYLPSDYTRLQSLQSTPSPKLGQPQKQKAVNRRGKNKRGKFGAAKRLHQAQVPPRILSTASTTSTSTSTKASVFTAEEIKAAVELFDEVMNTCWIVLPHQFEDDEDDDTKLDSFTKYQNLCKYDDNSYRTDCSRDEADKYAAITSRTAIRVGHLKNLEQSYNDNDELAKFEVDAKSFAKLLTDPWYFVKVCFDSPDASENGTDDDDSEVAKVGDDAIYPLRLYSTQICLNNPIGNYSLDGPIAISQCGVWTQNHK